MFGVVIYEDDGLAIRLNWFGVGRSAVTLKRRGITIKATTEEHRYFQDCVAAFTRAGITDALDNPRILAFYREYGEAISVRGGASWRVFFSMAPDDQVAIARG